MKQIDWNQHVPLGMDGKKIRNWLSGALGLAVVRSMQFLLHYAGEVAGLYNYQNIGPGKVERILVQGSKVRSFDFLIERKFSFFALAAACMVPLAVLFYCYHYLDGRSIYTMRRLPDGWELWRRCMTVPVCFAVICGLSALLLYGLYYMIYLLCTPAGCLP